MSDWDKYEEIPRGPVHGPEGDEITVGRSGAADPERVPFWSTSPEAWDTVIIEKQALPGLCRIDGEGFEQRVNKTKVRGRHGSSHRYVGKGNVDFTVDVLMWTQKHLETFARIVTLITHAPKPTKTRKVITKVATGVTDPFYLEKFAVGIQANQSRANAVAPFALQQGDIYADPFYLQQYGLGYSPQIADTQATKVTVETYESSGPRTVEIYHPALALFGIRTATVMRISLPTPSGDGDVYRASLRCSQLMLGKLNAGTGAKGAAGGDVEQGGGAFEVSPAASLKDP